MSTLSAPTIVEPIYECASNLYVQGYVSGATVSIYAEPPNGGGPIPIGGGVSNATSGQIFGVAQAQMVRGATITATQNYGGTISPASPPVTVQSALSVDAPALEGPLYECARCVVVEGLLPGVRLEILDGATTVGHGLAPVSGVELGVWPGLVAGHAITARQVYCGTPGPDSQALDVATINPKTPLPAPEIKSPLFACQPDCVVQGCTPSSQVEVFVNGSPRAAGCCAGGASNVDIGVPGGLIEGTSIAAQLSRCGGTIVGPMSAAVVVQPAADIPRPAIWPPLYAGDTSVLVAMTVNGEIITITADGTQIGMGGAGGGNWRLNVDPPLTVGQQIVASAQLCNVTKQSLPVTVLPPPTVIPAPVLVKPLYACSLVVRVAQCIVGAEVRIYASSGENTVLLGVGTAMENTTTVDVTPPLQPGWSVYTTQTCAGVTSPQSASVSVIQVGTIPPPLILEPVYACSRCVSVLFLIAGAMIDVYQDGVWVGGLEASTDGATVPVYPGLTLNATITVTQTICGKPSDAAVALIKHFGDKMPTPQLLPAYASQSSVGATGLVPGAIAEVEEISVYNAVIGRTCVSFNQAGIPLDLPLFTGALLRARQTLCDSSQYSPIVEVPPPPEWPLGPGPYKAGFRSVSVPASEILVNDYGQCTDGSAIIFVTANPNKAIVYYPAAAEGENQPVAGGEPFPIIAYAHGRRQPACTDIGTVCLGAPIDTSNDYQQISGILSHLARWGFVSIALDLHWCAFEFTRDAWDVAVADAANYLIAQNSDGSSPFHNRLQSAEISLMGHSTGGAAAIDLGTGVQLPVAALGLLAPADGASVVSSFAPRPILVLHGTLDTSYVGDYGRSANVYAAAGPPKHWVSIDGANHFGFTDSLCLLLDPAATISPADQQTIAKAYLTAFFRRYVQNVIEVEGYLTGARQVEQLEGFGITVNSQV